VCVCLYYYFFKFCATMFGEIKMYNLLLPEFCRRGVLSVPLIVASDTQLSTPPLAKILDTPLYIVIRHRRRRREAEGYLPSKNS